MSPVLVTSNTSSSSAAIETRRPLRIQHPTPTAPVLLTGIHPTFITRPDPARSALLLDPALPPSKTAAFLSDPAPPPSEPATLRRPQHHPAPDLTPLSHSDPSSSIFGPDPARSAGHHLPALLAVVFPDQPPSYWIQHCLHRRPPPSSRIQHHLHLSPPPSDVPNTTQHQIRRPLATVTLPPPSSGPIRRDQPATTSLPCSWLSSPINHPPVSWFSQAESLRA